MPDLPSTSHRIAIDRPITAAELGDVFRRLGIRRPTDDLPRLQRMLDHADLVATAWDGEALIGVARCLADFAWVCYLSDLAVDRAYQGRGIGRALVAAVQEAIGPRSQLLLLAAPGVEGYYPKLGFEPMPRAFLIKRAEGDVGIPSGGSARSDADAPRPDPARPGPAGSGPASTDTPPA